ncbi:MAG: (2Fe-2S)-binding protein [Desulfarculus sp.]|nr:(2Fe-2S)-binding protein [Desulfarculus sp.]
MATMVCYCSGVSKGQVLRAMEDGARTLEDIKALTAACTVAKCKELSPRRR